ncbi:class I SAM-dependent methyltransferase [Dyadobacter sp. CY351]|uniref:class I SAM-dependent methyltransferase n=1 Tax=Dyadobacter sp. CY351 TaxID=2909337 RepID=UPI001F3AA73A|nr:class I SAM-dependent methyltransferase [Dyadobacter sp. CY351]MCF2517597.1 class I SAM-dependent methyltransferase [Dyadobacter sp. CY351]
MKHLSMGTPRPALKTNPQSKIRRELSKIGTINQTLPIMLSNLVEQLLSKSVFDKQLGASQINLTIDPDDEMFVKGHEEAYFQTGISALQNIAAALLSAGKDPLLVKHVLDFPCGYGRVMRFSKAYFPNAEFYGSEITQRHLDFCAKTFDAKIFLSKDKFAEINVSQKFDVIWVGSLFTHLSSNRFKELYEFLISLLKEDGVLIFTTHGRFCYGHVQKGSRRRHVIEAGYLATGFGYCHQHGTTVYGDSLTNPKWLFNFIQKNKKGRVIYWAEQGWNSWQDVIAVVPSK